VSELVRELVSARDPGPEWAPEPAWGPGSARALKSAPVMRKPVRELVPELVSKLMMMPATVWELAPEPASVSSQGRV
jgi:hypothetical protein